MNPILNSSPTLSRLERRFLTVWQAIDGPELKQQHRFDERRKWRLDFAHTPTRIAIETEGGVWTSGRHTRARGYIADCEKYNAAAMQGWRVFRLASGMVTVPWCEAIRDLMLDGAPESWGESSAARFIRDCRTLLMQPTNQRLAASFLAGRFALAWDSRKRRAIMVDVS